MKQFNVKKLFVTEACLHFLNYMYLYMSCAVVKNYKIILLGQKWCVRLNKTLKPALHMYMINTFPLLVNQSSRVW